MSHALALGSGRLTPAGLLVMSGFIPTVPGWDADLAAHRDLPVMTTHGTEDPVISVEFARDARRRLESAGLPVTYRESPMPHTIDPRIVPDIQEWVGDRIGLPT